MRADFKGPLDIAAITLINFVLKHYSTCVNSYVLCKYVRHLGYACRYIINDSLFINITTDTLSLFNGIGQQFNINSNYDIAGGKVVAESDNFSRFKDMNSMSYNKDENVISQHVQSIPWNSEEVAKKMGFFTIDGVEGCDNARIVDILNPAYSDDERFMKALDVYVSYMSDCYANRVDNSETSMFHILSKMAPNATKLYNYEYGVNVAEIYCKDLENIEDMRNIDNLDELVKIKREYVEKVFGDDAFNEYDKRFASNVILSEFVMWSRYDEDYIKHTVSPYFVKFFEEHKEYIPENSNDWKEWNEKCVPNKSRWMNE